MSRPGRAFIERASTHPNRVAAIVFACCAYLPILLTDPGRVSADTKSYLTIDPGALLGQATSMWDPSVGAGTVPHQNIGYLFPLGPYYWLMDTLGVADWVTQRLLWGTIVFAAAFGTYRLARWLGWSATGAFVAGFAYGFSPYVLSYLARLSIILAPWAALPWMILLTAKAARTRSWKPAAQFAVVVALIGSVNATALVLAGLGPVIWLIADVVTRRVPAAAAVRAAAKIGVLSAAVSIWWIVALRLQGAYGIPILRYTETYESIAESSTPAEVIRGLGYWFLYGGDRLDPWVEPASAYFNSVPLMALGFLLAGVALLGFLIPFSGRATFAIVLVVGLAVAVGAAPLDASTPYGALFRWFASDTTAGLALRSTTRAAPLVVLALAFGLAASSEWVRARVSGRMRHRAGNRPAGRRVGPSLVVPAVVVTLVALQFFPWFTTDALSSSLQRDEQIPDHVTELAEWLDANPSENGSGRVWEIPAADFANYRWGGTVDPALPGLIDRPYVAREIVLQGGVATADFLNAFERRLPEGWFEPETLEPIAQLLGVDTVVTRNDLEHERYLLARPGAVWPDITGALGDADFDGPMVADETEIPLIDERTLANVDLAATFPVVAAFDLAPAPIARAVSATAPLVLAGSAEGIVDLAGAGLLDPDQPVLFAATLDDLSGTGDFDPAMLGSDPWWVVSDTNRRQARHWSTVSANLGALETATGSMSLDPDPGNQQLDIFLPDASDRPPRQTVAVHAADVADVRASYYGNRVAFTTGDAPAFAIDGDPNTAWRAGAFGPTTGLHWEVDLNEPVTTQTISLLQPITGATNRYIVDARLTLDADLETETTFDVVLDENSRSVPGQAIELPIDTFQTLRIEVRRDNIGELADYSAWPGVGLAEVTIPGVRDDRIVRMPGLDAFEVFEPDASADDRLSYVLTRQRIDPATPNESPGETTIVREFVVPSTREFSLFGESRVAADASEELLSSVFDDDALVIADRRLRGSPATRGASAFDDDPTTVWQTPFNDVVDASVTIEHSAPVAADVLTLGWLDDGLHSIPTEVTLTKDDGSMRVLAVPATAPVDGRASTEIDVAGYRSTVSTLSVTAVEERTSPEYFSRLPNVLPLGISDIRFATAAELSFDRTADLDATCRSDLLTIDDLPVSVRIVGNMGEGIDREELVVESCGDPIELTAGAHRLRAAPGALTGFDIDRLVLDSPPTPPVEATETPPSVAIDSLADTRLELGVDAADAASWLVLSQSWNAGWTATVDGESLGPPVLINGYANGWLLPASDTARTVVLDWAPQGTVTLALWFSLVAGVGVVILLLATRRDTIPTSIHADATEDASEATRPGTSADLRHPWRSSWILAVGWLSVVAFLAGPIPAIGGALVLLLAPARPWIPVVVVFVVGSVVAGAIVALEWRYDYPPGPDWPSRFTWTAPLVWLCVAAVTSVAVMPDGVERTK
jgi:arabinofuranan 3-O-arabinosyltransferase